jgi:hypothetical protein
METVIPPMLEDGVRVLVYSGQEDFICNWFGGRAWVQKMQWSGSAQYRAMEWSDWKVSAASAGTFKEQGGLTFLGVANAGHMVPMDQGENALVMLHTFIDGKSFRCDVGSRRDMVGCDQAGLPPSEAVNGNATATTMLTEGHGDYCFLCSKIVNYALEKGCDAVLCDIIAGIFGQAATAECKKLERVASVFGHSLCGYIEEKAHLEEHAEAICADLNCEGDKPAVPTTFTKSEHLNSAESVTCEACTTVIDTAIGDGCDEFACGAFWPYAPACVALEDILGLFGDSFCDWVQQEAGTGKSVEEICADLGACSSTLVALEG